MFLAVRFARCASVISVTSNPCIEVDDDEEVSEDVELLLELLAKVLMAIELLVLVVVEIVAAPAVVRETFWLEMLTPTETAVEEETLLLLPLD